MIYICINHPLPSLIHMFCLQRFLSIFESSVALPGQIGVCTQTI